MIGQKIRSIRHLWRKLDNPLPMFFKIRGGSWVYGHAVKITDDKSLGDSIAFFNDGISHYTSNVNRERVFAHLHSAASLPSYTECIFWGNEVVSGRYIPDFMGEMILLPMDFKTGYEKFLNGNKKATQTVCRSCDINIHGNIPMLIYIYTQGSYNFFTWALNAYFRVHVSMDTIRGILLWADTYKQLVKKLSKGTITAYTTWSDINGLYDEMRLLKREKCANDAINEFNTQQKKLLRQHDMTDRDMAALCAFENLSDAKRVNFIKKMSTIADASEIMRQMHFLVKTHFLWNKQSVMDYISNVSELHCEVVKSMDNALLLKVDDYDAIKRLGKNTNWCISKNKSYWVNYVERFSGKATQYILMDFSKREDDSLSTIGFTVINNRGITNAHDFFNNNMLVNTMTNSTTLKSYVLCYDETVNIFDALKLHGINIEELAKYDVPDYPWTKDGLMHHIGACIPKYNISILLNKGDKLVIRICDDNINKVFGVSYREHVDNAYWDYAHLIFADFNKSQYDPTHLYFAIIGSGSEEYCVGVHNANSNYVETTLDALLMSFNLPYNTIRRPLNPMKRLLNAFTSFDVKMVRQILKEENWNIGHLLSKMNHGEVYGTIRESILTYMSFDYLDLIYENGIDLSDAMGQEELSTLGNNIYDNLIMRGDHYSNNAPSEQQIADFYNQTLRNTDEAWYVGDYLALRRLIEHETANYSRWLLPIVTNFRRHRWSELDASLALAIFHNNNFTKETPLTNRLLTWAIDTGHGEVLEEMMPTISQIPWCQAMLKRASLDEVYSLSNINN